MIYIIQPLDLYILFRYYSGYARDAGCTLALRALTCLYERSLQRRTNAGQAVQKPKPKLNWLSCPCSRPRLSACCRTYGSAACALAPGCLLQNIWLSCLCSRPWLPVAEHMAQYRPHQIGAALRLTDLPDILQPTQGEGERRTSSPEWHHVYRVAEPCSYLCWARLWIDVTAHQQNAGFMGPQAWCQSAAATLGR